MKSANNIILSVNEVDNQLNYYKEVEKFMKNQRKKIEIIQWTDIVINIKKIYIKKRCKGNLF